MPQPLREPAAIDDVLTLLCAATLAKMLSLTLGTAPALSHAHPQAVPGVLPSAQRRGAAGVRWRAAQTHERDAARLWFVQCPSLISVLSCGLVGGWQSGYAELKDPVDYDA